MLCDGKKNDSIIMSNTFTHLWGCNLSVHVLIQEEYFSFSQQSRAVKKFSSSRLIMNSRRLQNSHQRHKFLRAEASKNILKFRVSEMAFPGIFKMYLPPRIPCCFVRILATLGTMPSKCHRRSTTSHGSNISQI